MWTDHADRGHPPKAQEKPWCVRQNVNPATDTKNNSNQCQNLITMIITDTLTYCVIHSATICFVKAVAGRYRMFTSNILVVTETKIEDCYNYIFSVFCSIFTTFINIKDESVQHLLAGQDSSHFSLHVFPANMVQSHEHESLAGSNTCHFISDTCILITPVIYLCGKIAVWGKIKLNITHFWCCEGKVLFCYTLTDYQVQTLNTVHRPY